VRLPESQRRKIRRLLVRSTNWIGDAVMTTPAVRAIRQNFPNAEIGLLVKPWVAPVFSHSPRVDRLVIYDAAGRHRGVGGLLRLCRDLRKERFDAAILLQNAFEAALIGFLSGIPVRIGFDTDGRRLLLTHPVRMRPAFKQVHQTAYYLRMLEGAGLAVGTRELEVRIGSDDRRRAAGRLAGWKNGGPLVGLNPSAAYGPAKQWPPDRYAALADALSRDFGARIVLFGGPGDGPLGARIAAMMQGTCLDLSGKTELGEAMALIEACDLFITNDSGLMHAAAALQVPSIAIFGSTNPVTTGPHSPRSRVVRHPLPCSPCLKPHCPEGHLQCMAAVDVQMVLTAAGEFL
jgi:heptosyltransferase-2